VSCGKQGYKRYNRAEISTLVEVQHELAGRHSHDLDEDPLVCSTKCTYNTVLFIYCGVTQCNEICISGSKLCSYVVLQVYLQL
jgi:hypothetical protein